MLLTFDVQAKQYEPLYETDFQAAWTAITAIESDYVLFFNCGKDGGCSRLRKHMQLIPMPKGTFASFLDGEGQEPDVPFQWYYRRFAKDRDVTVEDVIETYNELLEKATEVGKGKAEHAEMLPSGAACPHNMILTKRWMIVFPRRKNGDPGASTVGMLGYIAVSSEEEIDKWVKGGINNTMREFGVPRVV
jgi:ATP adenylyltransferase/5',5'''-P-1,P-4-tetraphosphate phosphorylase II